MLMIMIHHAYKVFVSDYGYPSNMIVNYWGDLGTGVFFFISGYGLFHSLTKSGNRLLEYLGGAIKKLLVPYVFIFAISVSVMAVVNPSDMDLSLIMKFFTLTIPYTTTQFFKVICELYLVSIFAFYSKIGESAKIGIVTLCVLLYFYFGKYIFHMAPYLFCTTINFPIGMLFAKVYRDRKVEKLEGLLGSVILFVLCLKFRDYPLALYSPFFSLICVFLCSFVDVSNGFLIISEETVCFSICSIQQYYTMHHWSQKMNGCSLV